MGSRRRRIANELYGLGGGTILMSIMSFAFYRTDLGWTMLAASAAFVVSGVAIGIWAGPERGSGAR